MRLNQALINLLDFSLPPSTYILELANSSLNFTGPGITQTITPNTRNGVDSAYTFILQDASIANITPIVAKSGQDSSQPVAPRFLPDGRLDEDFAFGRDRITTPVFLNETERKRSITITSKSVNIIARSITAQTLTNVTVVGVDTGATFNIPITVKADPSKL